MTKKGFLLFLFLGLFFTGCAATHKQNKNSPNLSPVPPNSPEVAMGEKINAEILSSFYPYTDPKVVAYVNKVGSALAAKAARKDLPYRFTILYNDKIYATSAPGGFIYLTTGMLYFLDNEAELAAVLAHEIGELQYHDPTLSRSKKILNAMVRGGTVIGPAFGEIGALAALGLVAVQGINKAGQLTPEKKLQQADKWALSYMVEGGYDPQGMIDFFYSFLKADKDLAPYFFDYYQSRPITEDRYFSVQEQFSKLPLQNKAFTTNRQAYQDVMQGVQEIYKR